MGSGYHDGDASSAASAAAESALRWATSPLLRCTAAHHSQSSQTRRLLLGGRGGRGGRARGVRCSAGSGIGGRRLRISRRVRRNFKACFT